MRADDEPMIALLARAGGALCALPLGNIVETMRPLPVEPVPGAPDAVAGVALVRGAPLPVVRLGRLVGADTADAGTRLVVLQVGERRVGLLVEAVIGVRELDHATASGLPPLLHDPQAALAGLGARDGELLRLLDAARTVPPESLVMAAAEPTAQ